MFHTTLTTMTQEQKAATMRTAVDMLFSGADYTPELSHAMVYSYWDETTECFEAWLTDGNPEMMKAVKYEFIASMKPQ